MTLYLRSALCLEMLSGLCPSEGEIWAVFANLNSTVLHGLFIFNAEIKLKNNLNHYCYFNCLV